MSIVTILVLMLTSFRLQTSQGESVGHSSIQGTVKDEADNPMHSHVDIFQLITRDGRTNPILTCSTQTARNGQFLCSPLARGRYVISVKPYKTQIIDPRTGVNQTFRQSFYPSNFTSDNDSALQLGDNESAWAPIEISPSPAGTIKGKISACPKSASLRLASLSENSRIEEDRIGTYSAQTGDFVIEGVPYGKYVLSAHWSQGGIEHSGSVPVLINSKEESSITVEEDKYSSVNGNIQPQGAIPNRVLGTLSLDSDELLNPKHYTTIIASDNSFVFPSVLSGTYVLRAILPDHEYIESVAMQGRNLENHQLLIGPDVSISGLNVQLNQGPGTIVGRVDPRNASGTKSSVVMMELVSHDITVTDSDARGSFSFTGVAPGKYQIVAWHSLEGIEYRNPLFLNSLFSRATTVLIGVEKETFKVEVPML